MRDCRQTTSYASRSCRPPARRRCFRSGTHLAGRRTSIAPPRSTSSVSRYFQRGLAWARSPYAFHTVGSTMVVHALCYAQVRGVPRRRAGEDFYLLGKLSKLRPLVRLTRRPRPASQSPVRAGAVRHRFGKREAGSRRRARAVPPRLLRGCAGGDARAGGSGDRVARCEAIGARAGRRGVHVAHERSRQGIHRVTGGPSRPGSSWATRRRTRWRGCVVCTTGLTDFGRSS